MAAGFGSVASASEPAAVDNPFVLSGAQITQVAPGFSVPDQASGDAVDVSRSYDRETLARQVALQTEQREIALEQSDRDVEARATDLEEAEQKRQEAEEERRRNQWVLPVTGYTLSARFGQMSGLWSSGSHTGLDFAGPSGSEIVAVAAGTVTAAGYSGAYGNRTVIELEDGTEISYSHQSRIVVNVGDTVTPGQVTGYTGATGNVTGPHLHLEVKLPGSGLVDPATVLGSHGVNP